MSDFNWVEPDSLEEAKDLLSSGNPNIRIVSGGTALSLIMRQGIFSPETLISLKRLKSQLDYIRQDEEGNLFIGAMTTLRTIETSHLVRVIAPVISQALKQVANPRIRYVASIGGNLAHGDAHLDLPPILLALGASVKVENSVGFRWIEIQNLYKGYYETNIAPDEILTEVYIPKQPQDLMGTYLKYTTLSNDDWPTVGVAAYLKEDGLKVTDVRLVVSAATDIPTRLHEAEDMLMNKNINPVSIAQAAEKAYEVVSPLEDLRGSAWYKKEMVKVHVRRALLELFQKKGGVVSE